MQKQAGAGTSPGEGGGGNPKFPQTGRRKSHQEEHSIDERQPTEKRSQGNNVSQQVYNLVSTDELNLQSLQR